MSFEYGISFSNGHIYIYPGAATAAVECGLQHHRWSADTRQGEVRPGAAPTNRGNEHIFGRKVQASGAEARQHLPLLHAVHAWTRNGLLNHCQVLRRTRHPAVWCLEQDCAVTDATRWYKDCEWRRLFKEIWNETVRLQAKYPARRSFHVTARSYPGSIFDNIANVGMNYILNRYKVMDKLSFMIGSWTSGG